MAQQQIKAGNGIFLVKTGRIEKTKADVIVCPIDRTFRPMEGLSETIRKSAGKKNTLREDVLGSESGLICVRGASLVDAGKLNAKKIAYVVSGNEGEYGLDTIVYSVSKSLEMADKDKHRSLALPLIGTGLGSLPIPSTAVALAEACLGYLRDSKNLKTITLVVLDDAFGIAGKAASLAAEWLGIKQ